MNIITGDDRVLSPKASNFDIVSAIGLRTKHMIDGAPSYVEELGDEELMAISELIKKRSPVSILRFLSKKNGVENWELWDLNEMDIDLKAIPLDRSSCK